MNWSLAFVLALAVVTIVGAGAVAASPAAFFYGLGKLAWADLWPKLRPLLWELLKSSEETQKRNVADTRRHVDRDARGKERMR